VPAVTHGDGTERVRTVNREQNALFYHLLIEFKEIFGVRVLLNTSFNENEPIVHAPAQAIESFEGPRWTA